MVGDVVVGIHGNGALQSANGELGFAFFLKNFTEKNIRAGGSCIEPDGTLQESFGFVEFLDAGIGVGELVVCGGITGVDGQLLFELRDSFGNFGLIEIKFAQELMRQRKPGIECDSFFAVFLGDGAEVESKQQTRREEIRGGGIGRDLKHFCEGGAGVGIIFGLDVSDSEDVGGVYAGAGIPGLDFFEIGNGFGVFSGKIEREAGELSGLFVIRIFCGDALQ